MDLSCVRFVLWNHFGEKWIWNVENEQLLFSYQRGLGTENPFISFFPLCFFSCDRNGVQTNRNADGPLGLGSCLRPHVKNGCFLLMWFVACCFGADSHSRVNRWRQAPACHHTERVGETPPACHAVRADAACVCADSPEWCGARENKASTPGLPRIPLALNHQNSVWETSVILRWADHPRSPSFSVFTQLDDVKPEPERSARG